MDLVLNRVATLSSGPAIRAAGRGLHLFSGGAELVVEV
jgi:hypothetical protein